MEPRAKKIFWLLRHTHYIVWSTSSDQGLLCIVGGKRIKIKIYILPLVGGKNKKKLEITKIV